MGLNLKTKNLITIVPNHYLQVSFPTDIDTEFVYAQGQFDVVKRPIAKPNYSL